ncbi:hypothetical protein [Streptobacillus canis]|uniref:hypothetical protein n=1 Tax=Streptobacillus canis TaxID=2678686 RepID=UPI0012E0CFE8|nr:hypothetical protein [Streptobacillus canis]
MKNKGISLMYVTIFSTIILLMVSTILIYSFEKVKTIDVLMQEKYSVEMLEKEILRLEKVRIVDNVDRSDVA